MRHNPKWKRTEFPLVALAQEQGNANWLETVSLYFETAHTFVHSPLAYQRQRWACWNYVVSVRTPEKYTGEKLVQVGNYKIAVETAKFLNTILEPDPTVSRELIGAYLKGFLQADLRYRNFHSNLV